MLAFKSSLNKSQWKGIRIILEANSQGKKTSSLKENVDKCCGIRGKLTLMQAAQRSGGVDALGWSQKLTWDKGLHVSVCGSFTERRVGPEDLEIDQPKMILSLLSFFWSSVLPLQTNRRGQSSQSYWRLGSLAFYLCCCTVSLSYRYLYLKHPCCAKSWTCCGR